MPTLIEAHESIQRAAVEGEVVYITNGKRMVEIRAIEGQSLVVHDLIETDETSLFTIRPAEFGAWRVIRGS